MKKAGIIVLALFFAGFAVTGASAAVIDLYDWAFYVDGMTYEYFNGDSMPTTGALDSSGLGTLTWSTSAGGTHTFIAFFDHEIDEALNTYFNEYGTAVGAPAAGQTWEIDEPGYLFGDIYFNVLAGTLDNTNGVPDTLPDDVSMAMGWTFTLNPGDTGTVKLILSETAPTSGFYLKQTDPDSDASIYFYSTYEGGEYVIPEPGTLVLLGTGMVGLVVWRARRKSRG